MHVFSWWISGVLLEDWSFRGVPKGNHRRSRGPESKPIDDQPRYIVNVVVGTGTWNRKLTYRSCTEVFLTVNLINNEYL